MTTLGRTSRGSRFDDTRRLVRGIVALGLLAMATPASAEWTRVTEIPASLIFSVWTNGDTIAAGADTSVYVSTDAGASWRNSTKPTAGVTAIEAVWIRNGRLYAGTFGQGVFTSDDLGDTWSPFSQGLTGGFANSQLFVTDFQLRGDVLHAATAGAGVYARDLAGPGTWQHFGEAFEPNQASNVNGLALGGTRLLASAGSNGMVFHRDPGDAEWPVSFLDNVGLEPGLQAFSAAWTGTGWVVGTNIGVFRSVAGEEPWTPSGPGLGGLLWTSFATRAGRVFAAFVIPTPAATIVEVSDDDGATWGDAEVLPGAFVFKMAISGSALFAARADGLWRSDIGSEVSVEDGRPRLGFSLVGPHPVRDQARMRFVLPAGGTASIELFDILGRATGERIEGSWSPGPHEVTLDARRLSPGVYAARLTAIGAREVVRLVHVR